ncbi:MAG TPA: regulatory iron-sulfur-containing complex subunit RicT [Patescibacteria group bacterium]|nr:regulatory iron-sulfur-containing complex subunit RicT [Patescibacteria group bacterium]
MQIIEVQFAPWDQSYYFKPEDENGRFLDLRVGDKAMVKTSLGTDIGLVTELGEFQPASADDKEIKPVLGRATETDQLKYLELNRNRNSLVRECRLLIKKLKLNMKLVDAHVSFDAQRLVYAFIADGRVDFRELVRELTKKHQKTIRLQQIGVRDEARYSGDIGPCGRCLCCKSFLDELGNVSTDIVKSQQVAHRGADRLSGACGRLKCCLRYEQPVYESLERKLPAIGSIVKTKYGSGEVIGWHTLRGTVKVNVGHKGEYNVVEVKVK